ncbi:MAG: ribosome maturation factor RimP [Defluviicoccus sp.]|nr:ribosome maturation factor RimP [Defluviicoccus sp.]MDG4591813.1 ribosome maturation factor RimP [Defluviicoccus sp.]MDS4010398.1 ribosome maturation factor RimP [Defluviicoccus sp.]MDS4071993.1 ribosome maturation factor RimP [Defluviicoccus sp.]
MDLAGRVADLIRPTVEGMGYSLVRVQVLGQQRVRLQVMAERADGEPMQIDDCADVSRAISAVLDVEDPVSASYTLEVSSPGIDRPLVRLADYERFAGFEARIELRQMLAGRRRYQGRLLGVNGDAVRLAAGGGTVELPFADIARAKLVLTDDLLASRGQ